MTLGSEIAQNYIDQVCCSFSSDIFRPRFSHDHSPISSERNLLTSFTSQNSEVRRPHKELIFSGWLISQFGKVHFDFRFGYCFDREMVRTQLKVDLS